jgi:adenylate cyclase
LFWHSELYRLKGELLASLSGTSAEAQRCLHRAVGIARQQGAAALQLRAATSLARLWFAQGKRSQAREVLGIAYAPFRTRADQSSDTAAAVALLELIGKVAGKVAMRRSSNASQTPRLA